MEKVHGWSNWETWNFVNWEMDNLENGIRYRSDLDELETYVQLFIDDKLNEVSEVIEANSLTWDYITEAYNEIDIKEVARELYDYIHGGL